MSTIQPTLLSEAAFLPYGKIIKVPEKKTCKRRGRNWESWPCEAYFEGLTGFCIGLVKVKGGEALFVDEMEKHPHQEELLIPGDLPILLPVSSAIHPEDDREKPSSEDVKVFMLMPGDVVVLNEGVWHGACLTLATETTYFFGIGLKEGINRKPAMIPLNRRVYISNPKKIQSEEKNFYSDRYWRNN